MAEGTSADLDALGERLGEAGSDMQPKTSASENPPQNGREGCRHTEKWLDPGR